MPEVLRSQADAFLTALIIFIAPVVAVTDYLGQYRLHATNLFQTAVAEPSPAQIEHRMAMRAALLGEIQRWLDRNGHDLRSTDLRAYFTHNGRGRRSTTIFCSRRPGAGDTSGT